MKAIGTTEAAYLLGISTARLRFLLLTMRVKGAYKCGRLWKIPLYNGMPAIAQKKTRRGPKSHWRKRPPRAETYIHVIGQAIRRNHNLGTNEPTITVKCGSRDEYGHKVEILGPSEVIYHPHNPRKSGARVSIVPKPGVRVEIAKFAALVECDQQPQPETT